MRKEMTTESQISKLVNSVLPCSGDLMKWEVCVIESEAFWKKRFDSFSVFWSLAYFIIWN